MDSLKPTYQIINSIAASAADLAVNDKNLVIGPTSNLSPKINLSQDCTITRIYSVVETAQVFTYTPATPAANTSYGFTLLQNVDGVMRKVVVEYSAGATAPASATALCDLLRAALTKYINIGKIKVSGGGSSTVVVTGATGHPLFNMAAPQNGTVAETFTTKAPNATAGTALAQSSGVITVTTAAAHSLKTGALVSIAGATGFTFARNGVSTVGSIEHARIHEASSTTFTLTGVTGSGTNTGTITITVQPSEAAGSYAKVLAETADQGTTLAPVSGRQYSKYIFEYANPVSSLNSMSRFQQGAHILFADDLFDTATPTNFTNFNNGVTNIINGAAPGTGTLSTTANNEMLANPSFNN